MAPRTLTEICRLSPVIPVVEIDAVEHAVPLAEALLAGGIRVIEVTLRTVVAADAIEEIVQHCPDMTVGAGTCLSVQDLDRARLAGAAFAVSPGSPNRLLSAADSQPLPMLPGVATATEAMMAADLGFEILKLFPAEVAGGVPLLRALQGPLQHLSFCPTGGITLETASDYLALRNVICVGGSWIAPRAEIRAAAWERIQVRATEVIDRLQPEPFVAAVLPD